jgi:transposase
MNRNPLSGEVFIFLSKNRRSIKILQWDDDGFLLHHKRLERGAYEMPRKSLFKDDYGIEWRTFLLMMEGVSTRSAKFLKRFESGLK